MELSMGMSLGDTGGRGALPILANVAHRRINHLPIALIKCVTALPVNVRAQPSYKELYKLSNRLETSNHVFLEALAFFLSYLNVLQFYLAYRRCLSSSLSFLKVWERRVRRLVASVMFFPSKGSVSLVTNNTPFTKAIFSRKDIL
jgi:hypothetical protein